MFMTRSAPLQSILLIALGASCGHSQRLDCRSEEVNTCIRLADPLLQANHVFPVNNKDIDHVCNVLFPETWSKFVDCIKEYTSSCLSQDQKSDFNRAVGDSINSVHKMCTNEAYKTDYFRHADCIKEKSMNPEHCGDFYTRMIEMMRGNNAALQRELCCSHSSFKECVIAETEACPCEGEACGQGMQATGFARVMLDKALGFLLKQCHSYVPDDRDCPIYVKKQEKRPRVEELDSMRTPLENKYDDGSYFPSGPPNRDERITDERMDERNQDDWTGLKEDIIEPQDNIVEERTTLAPFLPEPFPRDTTTSPVYEPFVPQQEDERRQPWLPSPDIKSFDDIFNTVTNTQAQELASSANILLPSLLISLSLIIIFF